MKKVKYKPRKKTDKSKLKEVAFVATHYLLLNFLHKMIRDSTYLFYMDEEVTNLFLQGPIVSFKGAGKWSSYFVKAKLYPLHRKLGSKNDLKTLESFQWVCHSFRSPSPWNIIKPFMDLGKKRHFSRTSSFLFLHVTYWSSFFDIIPLTFKDLKKSLFFL